MFYQFDPLAPLRVFLDALFIFYIAMWIIFPAYLANAVAVPVSRGRTFHPIDGGRMMGGTRILGDGKTVEGLLISTGIGILGGLGQQLVGLLVTPSIVLPWYDFYAPILVQRVHVEMYTSPNLPSILRAIILPPGAMLGDLLGSFLKRRVGIPRGRPAPVIDQLDFLAGAILLSLLLLPVKASMVNIHPLYLVSILALTAPIHVAVNKIAYRYKLKNVPH